MNNPPPSIRISSNALTVNDLRRLITHNDKQKKKLLRFIAALEAALAEEEAPRE